MPSLFETEAACWSSIIGGRDGFWGQVYRTLHPEITRMNSCITHIRTRDLVSLQLVSARHRGLVFGF